MEDVLIYAVEDDEGICAVYEGAFEGLYNLQTFGSGAEFFEAMAKCKPDLIILDIMLPDMDGFAILSGIRQSDALLPVIIVSAKSDELSLIRGLNRGADDYMAKPFSVLELIARVRTNLRRKGVKITSAGEFTVDNNAYKISYGDRELNLTLKEFRILKLLIEKKGVTLGREELFRAVWGDEFFGETRTLDMHIASLRDKIKEAGGKNCIVTVRGVGYRFEMQ